MNMRTQSPNQRQLWSGSSPIVLALPSALNCDTEPRGRRCSLPRARCYDGPVSTDQHLLLSSAAVCLAARCRHIGGGGVANGNGYYLGSEAAILLPRGKSGYLPTRRPGRRRQGSHPVLYVIERLPRPWRPSRVHHVF